MGKPLDPAHDHTISLESAAAQTRAYRNGRPAGASACSAFNAKPVLALLQQPGCVGVRIYQGLTKTGDASLVLVGVDAEGNDMTAGVLIDNGMPCPPWCSDGNALNG